MSKLMTEQLEALQIYRTMKNALKTEGIQSLKVTMNADGNIEIDAVLEYEGSNPPWIRLQQFSQ